VVIKKIQTIAMVRKKNRKILKFIIEKKFVFDLFILNLSNIKNVKINAEINIIIGCNRE